MLHKNISLSASNLTPSVASSRLATKAVYSLNLGSKTLNSAALKIKPSFTALIIRLNLALKPKAIAILVAFLLLAVGANSLVAEDLANPNQFQPLVSFSPPPIITPANALSHKLENQFDATKRGYHSVTNTLDNAFNPFHFATGLYGNSTYSTLLGKFRASKVYGALNAHYTKANDYKDGNGKRVGFGYKRVGANAMFGVVPNAYNELKATFLFDNILDDKQPHYMMDALRTTRYVFRFDYRLGEENLDNTLNLSALYRDISRRANNFDLRANNAARTKMEVNRHILDIAAKYDISIASAHNQLGIAYTNDSHLAKRLMKQPTASDFIHNGYRFANVKVQQISAFDSLKFDFNEMNALNLGVHYDYNIADIKDKDKIVVQSGAQQVSANNMWFIHYGKRVSGKIKQDALSAALKYEFKPLATQSYALNLQSLERIPSNDERFVSINPAANASATPQQQQQAHAQAWVSNPFLKSERHNRVKFEADIKSEFYKDYMRSNYDENAFRVGFWVMGDWASDFIIYDRFRDLASGVAGLAAAQQQLYRSHIITRNVDARIFSANANAAVNFLGNFGVKFNIWASWGENDTDNRALYQIRPLEAQLNLDYEDYAFFGKFNVGIAGRAVAKQNRRDDSTAAGVGIDRERAGFALLDIYAGISLYDKLGLRFGVDNVLDKAYSEYVSASHVEAIAPTAIINAPGRSFYVSIHGNF